MSTMERAHVVRGVDHAAFPTFDPRGTITFYRDVLGFPVVHATCALGWGPGDHPDFIHFFFDIGNGDRLAFFYYFGVEPYRDTEIPDLLHRALSNLVLNAMDAMPSGGVLSVRTLALHGRVQLEVSDTGSGLSAEECGRLFTPYYTSKTHGTGLGLAIVQSVVSDHNGRVSVNSSPGRGTTFRIELPVNSDKLARSEKRQESAQTGA